MRIVMRKRMDGRMGKEVREKMEEGSSRMVVERLRVRVLPL